MTKIEGACPDCDQDPCRCAEWAREMDRAEAEEAGRLADFAETMLPDLWVKNENGLFVRRR